MRVNPSIGKQFYHSVLAQIGHSLCKKLHDFNPHRYLSLTFYEFHTPLTTIMSSAEILQNADINLM
ncbi:MAG: hypothetical protein F6K31_25670 [Symploca sp. SIO2G7]|nr:hypothetical protein [Symploca sp. SIO2G7]